MSKQYYLYEITNSIDDGTYVGVTSRPELRKHEHWGGSHNKYLNAAMKVYGLDKFSFTIIAQATEEDISQLEISHIQNHKDVGTPLYNVALGGLIGNGAPGEEHWNSVLTEKDVTEIRRLYSSNLCTQRQIATVYNISYQHTSSIIRGGRWASVGGPLTTTKQQVSKVANRRKLSDEQVTEVRNLAQKHYMEKGAIDITSIADSYTISRQSMRKLLKGESYPLLSGPLLGQDYYKEFGHGK